MIAMKDSSSLTRRKKQPKLKLVVSFNGKFLRRPPSWKLRYVGGETKIISVERFITFSKLKAKISDLFVVNDAVPLSSFSLAYLHNLADEEERPLGSIGSDDDVRRMISEFEKLEDRGKGCRLWVFVCNNSSRILDFYRDGDNGCDKKSVMHVNCEKLSNGCSLLCGKSKGLSENMMTQLSKSEKDVKHCDDSLRKMVPKQQLITNQLNKIRGVYDDFGNNGNEGNCRLSDLSSESESGLTTAGENSGFGCELHRVNMLDYEYRKGGGSEKFGEVLHVALPYSCPLNPKDGNLRVGLDGSKKGLFLQARMVSGCGDGPHLRSLSSYARVVRFGKPSRDSNVNSNINGCCHKFELAHLGNMNRENIIPSQLDHKMVRNGFAPQSKSNQLAGGANTTRFVYGIEKALGGHNNGISNHGFGSSETTKVRFCPCHLSNKRNVNELGNHSEFRFSSSISKHGQATRSNHVTSHQDKFGAQEPGYYVRNIHSMPFKLPYCCQEIKKHGDEDLQNCFLAYDAASCVDSGIKNPSPCLKATDSQMDPLTDKEKFENQHHIIDDNKKDFHLMNQQEIINISSFPENTCSTRGTELSCNYENATRTLQDGIASPVNISLHNVSLSSRKIEQPVPSADKNDPLQMSESKHLDVMGEERFISGLQFEKSGAVASVPSFGSNAKMEKSYDRKGEIPQRQLPKLSINEKDEDTDGNISLKKNGKTSTEIAAFYHHLAKRTLQMINNPDLEYIKELGSGAYGTVSYGKWKGSDVAIKRIKPNCFTEGTMEEDKLVADFWKEAHILGQLHHPNIVALYGVVTDGPVNNFATVTEYMVNGSLRQVLKRKDRTIDRRKRLIIAMDAAFGMEYLHEKNIVHFDLKSHNLLVNMRDPQRPVCKIGDLGLAKIKQRTLVSGGVRGTIPWMAPELCHGKSMVTEKVDVYSFGIVMWELLTGEEPYGNLRSQEILAGLIDGSLRPEIPSWCDPAWRSLMERCWSADSDTRPSFSEIAKELRAMAKAANIK